MTGGCREGTSGTGRDVRGGLLEQEVYFHVRHTRPVSEQRRDRDKTHDSMIVFGN